MSAEGQRWRREYAKCGYGECGRGRRGDGNGGWRRRGGHGCGGAFIGVDNGVCDADHWTRSGGRLGGTADAFRSSEAAGGRGGSAMDVAADGGEAAQRGGESAEGDGAVQLGSVGAGVARCCRIRPKGCTNIT